MPADDGLLVDAAYPGGPIADAATTVLRITVDGVTYTQSAYALFESLDANGAEQPAGAPDAEGRAAMRSFLDALTGLPDSAYSDASAPYVADGLRVYSSAYVPDPAADWLPVDWPLEDLATAGESAGDGLGDPLPGGHAAMTSRRCCRCSRVRTARRRSAPAARTTR